MVVFIKDYQALLCAVFIGIREAFLAPIVLLLVNTDASNHEVRMKQKSSILKI